MFVVDADHLGSSVKADTVARAVKRALKDQGVVKQRKEVVRVITSSSALAAQAASVIMTHANFTSQSRVHVFQSTWTDADVHTTS